MGFDEVSSEEIPNEDWLAWNSESEITLIGVGGTNKSQGAAVFGPDWCLGSRSWAPAVSELPSKLTPWILASKATLLPVKVFNYSYL